MIPEFEGAIEDNTQRQYIIILLRQEAGYENLFKSLKTHRVVFRLVCKDGLVRNFTLFLPYILQKYLCDRLNQPKIFQLQKTLWIKKIVKFKINTERHNFAFFRK